MQDDSVFSMLRDHVGDSSSAWALGTFGAVAEFRRDHDEPADVCLGDVLEAATARGALRFTSHPHLRAVAFERPLQQGRTWSQGVAICLPEAHCAMARRTTLTELGPDAEAVRPEDRDAILFDIGLGALQVDACIRTRDPELLAILRAAEGVSIFDPERSPMGLIVQKGPHRVFCAQIGRIEVFQPIPPPDGMSPEGPHTHVLSKLLRSGRTHAATEPLPQGLVPMLHLGPAHAMKTILGKPRTFDHTAFAAFQDLLARFGDAELLEGKNRVLTAIASGQGPDGWREPGTRTARAAARVGLAQAAALYGDAAVLGAWRLALGHDDTPDELDEQSQHG